MTTECSEAALMNRTRHSLNNMSSSMSETVCSEGITTILSESQEIELIVIIVLNTMSAIVGSVGNTLVFLAITLNKRLHTASNFFIASLSCADLLVCFAAQPQYIAYLAGYKNNIFFQIRRVFAWISTVTSVNNMFAVTVDRCIAVSSPYIYQTKMKKTVWVPAITSIWFTSLTLGVLSGFMHTARVVTHYYCIIVIGAMVVIYGYLFTVAQAQARKVMKTARTQARKSVARSNSRYRYTIRILARENKAVRTVSIVCGCFLLCWLPLLLLVFIEFFVRQTRIKNTESEDTILMLNWFNTLALCNSCINPFIYCLRNQDFKLAVRNLLFDRNHRLPMERVGRWTASRGSENSAAIASTLAEMKLKLKEKASRNHTMAY